MTDSVTNIVMAGLGGQGVIKSSDMVATAAFLAGHDVKKAEVHGMSQRGGSVSSDIRFGPRVLSPMVPAGEADYLVLLDDTQLDSSLYRLRQGGTVLRAGAVDLASLPTAKALNVAMLGMLSAHLEIREETWLEAIKTHLPERLHEANVKAFAAGKAAARP